MAQAKERFPVPGHIQLGNKAQIPLPGVLRNQRLGEDEFSAGGDAVRRWVRSGPFAEVEVERGPARKALRAAALLIVLGVVVDNAFILGAGVALLVLTGVAFLWDWSSLRALSYRRDLSEVRAFMGEEVTLTLTVTNDKPLPLAWLEVDDVFPASLEIEDVELSLNRVSNQMEYRSFWMPGALQRLTRRVTLHCTERGYHRFGPAQVRTGDGFGFFRRKAVLPGRQRLIVYPRIYPAAALNLPAKNPLGERSSKQRLFEDPLRTAGVRDWQPADGMRRVHWKATARHQRLLSRVYEPSEEAQVVLFLNVATLARHWEGHVPELFERTVSVAGSLAAHFVAGRLPVGLVANAYWPHSDQPLHLLPGRSPDQLTYILELLAAVTPHASAPIEHVLLSKAPNLPWGATLVVVTAVAHDALLSALSDLRASGRKVALFTLAEEPPEEPLVGVRVFHLPHLVAGLVDPVEVA